MAAVQGLCGGVGKGDTDQLEAKVPADGQREAKLQETAPKREMDGRWYPEAPGVGHNCSREPSSHGAGKRKGSHSTGLCRWRDRALRASLVRGGRGPLAQTSPDLDLLVPGVPSACKQVVSVETTRDIEWATYTCTLGFHVFGKFSEAFIQFKITYIHF